jgi:hypothetical protein
MNPAENLLSRLHRVRRTGPGRWVASSPTREDRHPSLAIRELDDGRVLVHDFGGDNVAAVLGAVGLELSDLFPPKSLGAAQPVKRAFSALDVLVLAAAESSVAVVICSDVLRGRAVSDSDFVRLLTAAQRLGNVVEVCHGNR